jgi:hypothetical protein
LYDEFVHFGGLPLYNECNSTSVSPEMNMYCVIIENDLQTCFPNVTIVLRLYLSLMLSNCSGERSLSRLKWLKNYQRMEWNGNWGFTAHQHK